MDWLTFTVEMIKAIAWPLVALIIFLSLRKPILDMLPSIERLRYRDLEIGFRKQVKALAAEARRTLPAEPLENEQAEFLQHMEELARLSPRAVVLEAWLQLEKAAVEASQRKGINLTTREARTPIILGQALEKAGVMDEEKQNIYYQLRNLRNAAAHASDFSFSPESAMEYTNLALRLTDYLQNV